MVKGAVGALTGTKTSGGDQTCKISTARGNHAPSKPASELHTPHPSASPLSPDLDLGVSMQTHLKLVLDLSEKAAKKPPKTVTPNR
ncbi:hypothetical protein TIFTF001_011288 [Ficus carica]|uniref:Uncharacterized protein n=1 Tax=Ficus carica TaxID=3494 RepID=A0AA87ZWX3_FICCA|nr:hypothetical protein TIFTF001_011288 [Ficus carica]